MRKLAFCICENKDAFVFATGIVQSVYFLNTKFQISFKGNPNGCSVISKALYVLCIQHAFRCRVKSGAKSRTLQFLKDLQFLSTDKLHFNSKV